MVGLFSIDFTSVADSNDQYPHGSIFYVRDNTIIPYSVFPEIAEFRALQRLSDGTRIIQLGNTVVKKLQDSAGNLMSEFV
ncbi:hypothetical protein FBZ99_103154 [Rhizobium sp. ERR 1071]|nr:hypothetical protein A9Z06_29015 [Rhizobium sp. YK2]TWB15784.1 hypothetical protein FBZ99_103154 [Rhizobium sp. ERR1071]